MNDTKSSPTPANDEKQTILVIDDSISALQILANVLISHGFDTLTARDGQGGIDKAEYAQPDLILLDVLMPDLDGFETCRRLKMSERTKNIPVVFMTSLNDIERKLTGFEVGAVDYLTKPVQIDEVLARVRTHLALRSMQKRLAAQNAALMREISVRQEAERGLRDAQTDLERRVAERTAELARANKSLTEEIGERRRAERDLQRSNRDLTLLNRVVAASVSEGDERGVCDVVCRELAEALEVSYVEAVLLDDQRMKAVVVARHFVSGESTSNETALVVAAEHVLRHRKTLIVSDISTDERVSSQSDRISSLGIGSLLAVPLLMQETIMGALELGASRPHRFSDTEVKLVESVASQVSGVLTRARLRAEQQRLEAQYHQAQKMEALGRLTGGVAHDFNNLLTVIIGSSELLLCDLNPGHSSYRVTDQIKTAARRAAGLTSQLLAFSRQQILQPQILDLNAIVANIEDMLRRLLGEDVDLKTICDAHLGSVRADAAQLEQVIVNLAVNARDAMPGGGALTIETRNVTLDEAYTREHAGVAAGPYVLLSVTDTGVGMDEGTLARVFDPFFTTKEKGKGTGLGLATTHGIVSQSGGHIGVYSALGQGASFKVYLPRIEGAVETTQSAEKPAADREASETILLLEDQDMVRNLIAEVLTLQGYRVLAAKDGARARQICTDHEGPIHLLLTDVVISGGGNGVQVAEAVKALRPETKVLFMSGYTANAVVHRGVLEPGSAFLAKPFTPSEISNKVREVLDAPKP
ncbi:MAG: response regulator [Vicinamibacteria bacterium]|nr:response regulator [Vicinamibacteria bacterium]